MGKIKTLFVIIASFVLVGIGVGATLITMFSMGVVSFSKDEIKITVENISKVYDGKELVANSSKVEGVPEGYTYELYYVGSQTDVGESESSATIKVLNSAGRDSTNDFDVKVTNGKLEVTKRGICVRVKDAEKEYDGTPLSASEYELAGGTLVDGDLVVPTYTTEVTSPTTVPVSAEATAKVYNITGHDISYNYEISYVYGELSVTKKSVVFELEDITKAYDGSTFKKTDGKIKLKEGELSDGDTFTATYKEIELTNVGTDNYYLDSLVIEDSKGNDVTKTKYDVSFSNNASAKATITRATLTVKTKGGVFTYDGEAKSADSENFEIVNASDFNVTLTAVADTTSTTAKAYVDAGVYDNETTVKIKSGSQDLTDNFDIVYQAGTIIINQAVVNVKGKSQNSKYTGEDIPYDQKNGDKDVFDISALPTNCEFDGSYVPTSKKEVGVYKVELEDDWTITSGEKNVSKNFTINYTPGEFEIYQITKITIIISSTAEGIITYDGQDHASQLKLEFADTTLSSKYDIDKSSIKLINANIYTDFDDVKIKNKSTSKDETAEFEIAYAGSFEIKKKAITLVPESITKTWAGESAIGFKEFTDESLKGLVTGDSATILNSEKWVMDDGCDDELERSVLGFGIFNSSGYSVSENYDVTLKKGKILINKLVLTFTGASITYAYDGTEPIVADPANNNAPTYAVTISGGSVPSGVTVKYVALDNNIDSAVGTYDLIFEIAEVKMNGAVVPPGVYQFDTVPGTLTIY